MAHRHDQNVSKKAARGFGGFVDGTLRQFVQDGARKGMAAGAIESAQMATETNAANSAVRGPLDPIRFQPDGTRHTSR